MSDTAEFFLRLENINMRFGTFQVLDRISLDIRRAEFICFLGPSGCGKTTLLRIIAGLERQSGGRINQAGADISDMPTRLRDFGIVFQSYALFPNLTVAQNVGYGLYSMRLSRAEAKARVAEMLDLVGISGHASKFPAQLSGGQQQRVALARALAVSPGLLLLDEPLSALDTRVRQRLRNELRALQQRVGVTTIMVTHDQEEALALADRIVVMNNGTVEQFAPPAEVYRNPASAFVADFVGEMNFFDGIVEGPGVVRVGDQLFKVSADNTMRPGSAVRLCIRPSEISVAQPGAENTVTMVLERQEFLGSFIRLHGRSEALGNLDLRVDLPTDLPAAGTLAGQLLSLDLPQASLRLFPGN